MAIDTDLCPDVDNLALPDKSFYPLKIPISHWQLRHYISYSDPDVLYYASGKDVYYLNTANRKKKRLVELPFEARCTASGHGYICVGGEYDGHFAIVRLEESRGDAVDATGFPDQYRTAKGVPRAAEIKIERIGDHIVNSISIHKIHDEEAHLYDVVAVLTNNDHTVRIYSLLHGIEVSKLGLPDAMNHATISPDGKMLAAVGDVNIAYFFTRVLQQDPPQIPKPHNRLDMSCVDWERLCQTTLYIPSPSTQKGYFTTAWSPRGNLLAVGAEAGTITVFDVVQLLSISETPGRRDIEDATVITIPSSRPNSQTHTCPGAVRSMLFTPDPWDLLIWAEDQGRICIGDLRLHLATKQIIDLNPTDRALESLVVEEMEPDDTPPPHPFTDDQMQRQLRTQDLEDDIGSSDGQLRQRNRRQARYTSRFGDTGLLPLGTEPISNGLTADEQRILESLRTARQREEALSQGGPPWSINYTTPSMFDNNRDSDPSGRDRAGASAQPYVWSEVIGQDAHRVSRRPARAARDRLLSDAFSEDRPLRLMRESSSRQISEEARSREDRGWGPTSGTLTRRSNLSIPPHAQRADTSSRDNDEGPWQIISDAMNLARGPLFESPGDTRAEAGRSMSDDQMQALLRQQERLRELRRQLESRQSRGETPNPGGLSRSHEIWNNAAREIRGFEVGWELLRRRSGRRTGMAPAFSGTEVGVRTAGLAISRDGRVLWAATEEGVFEIKLALKNRSRWPAVSLK